MPKRECEFKPGEFATLMIESTRYCLGRRSYAVGACIERIDAYMAKLSRNTLHVLAESIERERFIDDMQYAPEWRACRERILKRLEVMGG